MNGRTSLQMENQRVLILFSLAKINVYLNNIYLELINVAQDFVQGFGSWKYFSKRKDSRSFCFSQDKQSRIAQNLIFYQIIFNRIIKKPNFFIETKSSNIKSEYFCFEDPIFSLSKVLCTIVF